MYSVDSTTVHGRTYISLININRMDGQTNIKPSSLCVFVCVYPPTGEQQLLLGSEYW